MKKYSDSPLKVRLHHVQEDALQEMMSNTSYCVNKGFYSLNSGVLLYVPRI